MTVTFFARALPILTLAALVFTIPAAEASPYTSMVVFGDSLSDSGNNSAVLGNNGGPVTGNTYVPTNGPYTTGVYSNGPVWASDVASALGLTLTPSQLGGTNFAYGGATTGTPGPGPGGFPFSLVTQANQYLASTVASPTSLYVIEGGGNNVRAALAAIAGGAQIGPTVAATAAAYAANIGAIVNGLQAAGATHIVVWDTPNAGTAPATFSKRPRCRRFGDGYRGKHERRPRCATLRGSRRVNLRHLWLGHSDLPQSGSVRICQRDGCVRSSPYRYRLQQVCLLGRYPCNGGRTPDDCRRVPHDCCAGS